MRITLPLTLRGIIAGAALVFLESMRELEATLLLGPTGLKPYQLIYGVFMKPVISVALQYLGSC